MTMTTNGYTNLGEITLDEFLAWADGKLSAEVLSGLSPDLSPMELWNFQQCWIASNP